MKKLIMIFVAVLTVSMASQVKAQAAADSVKTPEQRIETIESAVNAISQSVESLSSGSSFNFKDIGEEVIIPLVAIIFSLGMPIIIILIIYIYKYKNRKAGYVLAQKALEAGKDIPEGLFKKGVTVEDKNMMAKGIENICFGLGLGIFLYVLTKEIGLACVGIMILLTGVGQVIIYRTVIRPREEKEEEQVRKVQMPSVLIEVDEDNTENDKYNI